MKVRTANPRRGILLLIILALLAMFAMIAVAFVVLTGHERRTADAAHSVGQVTDPPQETLDQAFRVVARGSNNPSSAVKACSLLEKIYGHWGGSGQIGKIAPVGNVANPLPQLLEFNSTDPLPSLVQRVGCVLTMIDGPAAGLSTRVVGLNPTDILKKNPPPQGYGVQILPFEGTTVVGNNVRVKNQPLQGNFIINGLPYSGMGFGYDSTSGTCMAKDLNSREIALLPNSLSNWAPIGLNSITDPNAATFFQQPDPAKWNPIGGANCDYSAADFQDPLLACQVYDPTNNVLFTGEPSLHRPELIQYWSGGNWKGMPPDLLRQVMFRPIGMGMPNADHPLFTGSNPTVGPNAPWDPLKGLLDVDNDGDGIPDSIWVDLGLPVRWTADGRAYKPLFAVLCLDMDGRLNINAHGERMQCVTPPTFDYLNVRAAEVVLPAPASPASFVFAGKTPSAQLLRGIGYGPAEVSLLPLFDQGNTDAARPLCAPTLQGAPGAILGRYGDAPGSGVPGELGRDQSLSRNRTFAYASKYWAIPDAFGTPPDPPAIGAVGLDVAGRPLYASLGGTTQNNPYEIDLGRNASHGLTNAATADNPFSVTEFERVLRPYDRDAPALPARLLALAPPTGPGLLSQLQTKRYEVTTESWHVPTPAAAIPPDARAALPYPDKRPRHITDLLTKRGSPPSIWGTLLPPELLSDLKMDLNRPFGNGHILPAGILPNQIVPDQPTDAPPLNPVPFVQMVDKIGNVVTVPLSYVPDGSAATAMAARQLYARHLYVLMMLLADTQGLGVELQKAGLNGNADDIARFIAQWAVNVAAYRDNNSVMIPFPYDPTPWNAWNPPNDKKHLVWGCKRPELLITEAIAFHDRRTEDLDDFHKTTDKPKKDNDFDQRFRPQGSLFVELYNPSSAMEPHTCDLYTAPAGGVELTKVVSDETDKTKKSPLWRLLIADPTANASANGELPDPDDPLAAKAFKIERVVYFVAKGAANVLAADGGVSYYPTNPPLTQILPGRYAVIGPNRRTFIGFEVGKTAGDANSTRQITLDPAGLTAANPFVVRYNDPLAPPPPAATQVYPPSVIVIDDPYRLSVTEPTDGYDQYAIGGAKYQAATEQYDTVTDVPFDKKRGAAIWNVLSQNTTFPGYKVIYLQRLANPLRAYDVLTNPYRTIDAAPIDLTCFNGVSNDLDPDAAGTNVGFATRQRGEQENKDFPNGMNIWKQEPLKNAPASTINLTRTHYFNKALKHTLGYLNEAFGAPFDRSVSTDYQGDPQQPFPWLNFSYRPFVNEYELLLVPCVRSSKLFARNDTDGYMYYSFPRTKAPKPYMPIATSDNPFPHLLNFFHSASGAVPDVGKSPQFHRILEYVRVPSPFFCSEIQANPTRAAAAQQHWFHPPFNRISLYREPGRVNLNTIANVDVLKGLLNYYPEMADNSMIGAFWSRFTLSRQGNEPASPNFGRPFRSFAGANLVPLASMIPPHEVDATILRSDPANPDRPLFQFGDPLNSSSHDYNNPNRNPYFRYQPLQKLGNVFTTRSNVFAVWITVGNFEVTPNPNGIDDGHPDGYQLGQELGSDTGEIERHRGFYIFDRSIPVGFIRGQDVNLDRAVLIRRFIE